jgi:hypothetical protein
MSDTLPVRVMVEEVWDQVALQLPPSTPVALLKRQALEMARVTGEPARYLVKFRGAEILDEQRSLAETGVVPNGTLIVMSRARRPVR